jgi:hypothetical protein
MRVLINAPHLSPRQLLLRCLLTYIHIGIPKEGGWGFDAN